MKSIRFENLMRGALLAAVVLLPQLLLADDGIIQPQPTPTGTLARFGFMFISVYLIFHFLVIKPQKTKLTDQQNLLSNLKRGDQVITSGGMVARVAGVEKEFALLELAPNVRVKFELAHIAKRVDKPVAVVDSTSK